MRTEIDSSVGQQAGPAGGGPGVEGYIDKHGSVRRLGRTVRSVDTCMAEGIAALYKLGRTSEFKRSEVEAEVKTD